MLKLFWLLIFQGPAVMAQLVQGVTVDSVTGRGIPGVTVDLNSAGDRYSATTDTQGRFVFEHVATGVYRAMDSAPDYAGASGAGRPPQFQVTRGARPVDLGTVRLTPLAGISGRVVDPKGLPVAGAAVSVLGGQFRPRRI